MTSGDRRFALQQTDALQAPCPPTEGTGHLMPAAIAPHCEHHSVPASNVERFWRIIRFEYSEIGGRPRKSAGRSSNAAVKLGGGSHHAFCRTLLGIWPSRKRASRCRGVWYRLTVETLRDCEALHCVERHSARASGRDRVNRPRLTPGLRQPVNAAAGGLVPPASVETFIMFAESPSLPRKLPPLGRNGQQAPAADRPLQEAGSGMLGPSMPPEAAESTAYVENRHMGGMKGSAQSVLSAGSDETPSKFGESKHLGSGGDLDTPVVRPGRGLEREAGPPRRRRCMFFGYTLWAHAAGAICTSLALFYLGNLGSAFAAASAKGVSPLWPPPGLLLAVTLSYRRTAGAWAGMGALAYALLVDERGPWAAAFKVASEVTYPLLFLCIVDMLLGQSATTKWQRPPSATRSIAPFDSPKGVLAVCVAAAASSALAATWGAASLLLFEGLPSDLGWITWATWTVGDFSGAILLMPFLRAWAVAVVRQEPVAAAVDEFGEGLQEGSPSRCAAAVRMLGRACLAALRAVFAALCRSGRRIAPDHASHRSNVGIASTPSPTAFASRNRVERIEPHEADTSAAWLDTPRLRVLEAVIWMGATVFLSLVGSGLVVDFRGAASLGHVNDGDGASSLVYLTIPPALYGAFRFGVLGSTLATMTSAAAMLGATLAYGTPYSDALLLDAFLVVLSVTSLLVTALMSRLNGVMAKLRRTQRRLAAAREHAEETARSKVAFLGKCCAAARRPA